MSGHSKWATIKHKKGATDKARGKQFAKLIKQVEVAARAGGGDRESNPTLRTMFQKARAASVPLDTIERAVKRGTGELEGVEYQEVNYEGYAPGGVAVYVEALTDNRNRTATNVRTAFAKNGGNLGASGAVSHGFERLGLIEYAAAAGDEDKVLEAAIEAGADDVESDDDGHAIWVAVENLHPVARELEKTLGEAEGVKLAWRPSLKTEVGEGDAATLLKLIDVLDDDDDVQTVWGNYEISDEVMAKLG